MKSTERRPSPGDTLKRAARNARLQITMRYPDRRHGVSHGRRLHTFTLGRSDMSENSQPEFNIQQAAEVLAEIMEKLHRHEPIEPMSDEATKLHVLSQALGRDTDRLAAGFNDAWNRVGPPSASSEGEDSEVGALRVQVVELRAEIERLQARLRAESPWSPDERAPALAEEIADEMEQDDDDEPAEPAPVYARVGPTHWVAGTDGGPTPPEYPVAPARAAARLPLAEPPRLTEEQLALKAKTRARRAKVNAVIRAGNPDAPLTLTETEPYTRSNDEG